MSGDIDNPSTTTNHSEINRSLEELCFHNNPDYSQYAFILYVGSPIALLGIFSNILLAIVFGGRQNCSTTNIYFSILAYLDIAICTLYILLFAVDALALYHEVYPLWKMWMGYVLPFLTLSKIVQLTSTYIVVAATVERFFIVVNFNFAPKPFCTPKRRQLVVIVILAVIVMFRLPTYWDYELMERPQCESLDRFSTVNFNLLLMANDFYKNVYNFYIAHLIQVFIPILVLIILNATIVYYLRRQLNLAKRFVCLFPEKCMSMSKIESGLSKDKVRKATYTLVAIVTSYLVCNSVNLFLSIMEHVARVPFLEDENEMPTTVYNHLTDMVCFLFMFNSSIRLFVHMASNDTLRRQLEAIFLGRQRRESTITLQNGTLSGPMSGHLNKDVSVPLLKYDGGAAEELDGGNCKEVLL